MHAVALNEKALIPTVNWKMKQNKTKTHTEKPTHLTALHLKMHHIGFVYNSTEFQESKWNKSGHFKDLRAVIKNKLHFLKIQKCYDGWEPSNLSIAALISPPVAISACKFASRFKNPIALSCSSCCWNLTSGFCSY